MIGDLKNTALFQSIFQSSAEGILVVNDDGSILMANPACEKLFGYVFGGLIGENIEILIPEKLKQQHKKRITNETDSPIEYSNVWGIKKDNTQFYLEISLSPTIIDGKNVTIAFLKDATKHKENLQKIKQTDKDLVESNRKFDTLVNNLKGILFRCKNNKDYEMDYLSQGCLEITGYPVEAFKNQTITLGQLILDEDRDYVWESIQNAIKQKKHYDFKCRIKHKNGTIKYVWEKGEAIYNNKNEVMALEGFITDVTLQKEAELELRSNEEKIKALLKAIPDIMFIQNRKGDYLDWYVNRPEKLSIPPEKFIGVNMKKVLPPNIYQKIKSSHNKAIASGKMQITDYSVQGKKGIEFREARVVLMNDHKLLTIVRDITGKKATDAQLNIKNNALASAGNSIIIADAQQPHSPIIYCNKAFEKMTGYTNEEALGRNSHFLQNDDRDQKEIDLIKNAIAQGEACNVTVRNYKKDGTMFWNNVTITPVYNEVNKLTHLISVQNDVTNKVKAESLKDQVNKILELIAKDKPLKIIGNKIVEAIETNLKDCIASILILDKKNKTLHKLVAPNLPKTFSDYIEGTAIGPKAGSCGTAAFLKKEIIVPIIETNVLWEDYKEIALKNELRACWSFPVMSSANQVLGTFAIYSTFPRMPLPDEKEIILDMTHLVSIAIENHNNIIALSESKKQVEKHAQKLEEKVQERTQEVMATVQKLVESNLNLEDQILIAKLAKSEAVISKSIASEIAKSFPNGFIAVMDKDVKVVLVEGEALAQLGLKHLIISGTSLNDVNVFSDEQKTQIKENIARTLAGQSLSFEINYKNRFFTVNTAPLIDENNEINNALLVYTDISEQKAIEFNIQNAFKKERELNDLKSRFVSMASHEFRTPLSAILTSAILIRKQNDPGKELKREKYVAQIEKNVKNLVVILNDFLSLSKLEEGKVVPMLEQFNLISFSKRLAKEINMALKKGQTISVTSNNEELYIYLDVKLLRHILNNLLSNASKYSPEATQIDFKILQNQENVLLQITDQGMGIPEEEQKYLFNRFFRADNAPNIEGTGLGLNIAKNYTELMGGNIGFKSQLNRGTTFWVEFPINAKE